MFVKVNIQLWYRQIEVSLVLREWYFVSKLKFAVFFSLFLDRVVSKMNEFVEGFQTVFSPGSPYVAVAVVIPFQASVYRSDHGKQPDVKFPVVIQSWVLDVSLENESSLLVTSAGVHNPFDFLQRGLDANSSSPVSILSWLDDPNILEVSCFLDFFYFPFYRFLLAFIFSLLVMQTPHFLIMFLLSLLQLSKKLFIYNDIFIFRLYLRHHRRLLFFFLLLLFF